MVVHVDSPDGPREVARHALTTPGQPAIEDEHYPPRPAGALERRARARNAEEAAFLALGPGAERWPVKAAEAGATRARRKIAEAVDLAKLHGSEEVSRALAVCAEAGRFGEGDLAAILAHQAAGTVIPFPPGPRRSRRCSARPGRGRDSGDDPLLSEIRALIDPQHTERVLGGRSLQYVSVIMTIDPPVDQHSPPWQRPAAVTVRPAEARAIAFELLCLAEHAERTSETAR